MKIVRMTSEEFVENYRFLVSVGMDDDKEIAEKLGIKFESLKRAKDRAKARGVDLNNPVETCQRGLHLMTPDNVTVVEQRDKKGNIRKYTRCLSCRSMNADAAATPEAARAARQVQLADYFELIRPDASWKAQAECRDSDVNFFPEKARATDSRVRKLRDSKCSLCPVRKECLTDALSYPDTVGVWGGKLFPSQIMEIDPTEWGIDV